MRASGLHREAQDWFCLISSVTLFTGQLKQYRPCAFPKGSQDLNDEHLHALVMSRLWLAAARVVKPVHCVRIRCL